MSSTKGTSRLCIVSSSGGHLFKILKLKEWWRRYDRFFVVRNDEMTGSVLSGEKRFHAYFPENRNFVNFVRNLVMAIVLLKRENPTVIFSMGAGVALPFLLVGKLMGIKTIFMETFILTPRPTLTGRICYKFVDSFVVQHPSLRKIYPRANYWGSVL